MVTSLVGMGVHPGLCVGAKGWPTPRGPPPRSAGPGAGRRRPGHHRPPSRRSRWHSEVGAVVFADAEHVQAHGMPVCVADGVGQPLPRLDLAAGGGVALQSLSASGHPINC
jgi:hypothetical protein